MVMWRQPAMRAPLSGFVTPNSLDKVNLWLRLIVTHLSQGHQTRHFILSNCNLFAAPFPQINISYLEVFWHSKKLLSLFLCLANTWLINVCGDMKDFTTFFGRQNPENQPTSGRLRNRVPPLVYHHSTTILLSIFFPLFSRILRILTEFIKKQDSSDSKLQINCTCSVEILDILEVIEKKFTWNDKRDKHHTPLYFIAYF